MKILPTPLSGLFILEPELIADERGFFAEAYTARDLEAVGLEAGFVQANISYNRQKGTLRGMHFQHPPHAEDKMIRCIRGAIYDVAVDIRESSPTYLKSFGLELTAENRKMLYIPKGFAHGFQTLVDDTEVLYQVTQYYAVGAEGGIRWDDPLLDIQWPLEPTVISEKDRLRPDFRTPVAFPSL